MQNKIGAFPHISQATLDEHYSCVSLRALESIENELDRESKAVVDSQRALKRALPRAIYSGLAEVQRVVEEKGIQGYHGPLIDNFQLRQENLWAAVEVRSSFIC